MSGLDKPILPFQDAASGQASPLSGREHLNTDLLLETAMKAYPQCWVPSLKALCEDKPEFLSSFMSEFGLVASQSQEDDFDGFDILVMQMATRLDVINAMQEKLVAEGYAGQILDSLEKQPMWQYLIETGNFNQNGAIVALAAE